jgi:hypothetical protein
VKLCRRLVATLVCALVVVAPAAADSYRLLAERDGLRVYGPASERSWGTCPRGALKVSRADLPTAKRAVLLAVPAIYRQRRDGKPRTDHRSARATGAGLAPKYARGASEREHCGERIFRRTIVVDIVFPRIARYSASLSQSTFLISRLPRGWVVWSQPH